MMVMKREEFSVNEYLSPTMEMMETVAERGFQLSMGGENEDMGDLEELF